MAARRLLIVMLVLLGISTLAAALVPTPEDRGGDETAASETKTTASVPDPLPSGEGKTAEITVGGELLPVVGSESEPVRVGDRLGLDVECKCSDLVEIPALGLIEAVAPGAPAHFELLFDSAGSYGIRLLDRNEVVGRIEVEEAKSGPAKKEPG